MVADEQPQVQKEVGPKVWRKIRRDPGEGNRRIESNQEFPRERKLDEVVKKWNDLEDCDRGPKEEIKAYICRFKEAFRELE